MENNAPENLAVLTTSDHVWLHKEFGNAVLNAFMRGLVSLSTLLAWTDDAKRAGRLLPLCCLNQVGSV